MAELLELGFSKTLAGYGQGNGDPAWSAAFTKTVFVKRGGSIALDTAPMPPVTRGAWE